MRRSTATSMDVARRAGVSQSTVSIVLNGKTNSIGISEATRQRVLAAATELGYSPDPAAKALRRGRSNIIGFVPRTGRALSLEQPVPFLLHDFCARAAARRGYHVVEIEGDLTDTEFIGILRRYRADGVLFHTPQTAQEVQQVVAQGWSVVQLMVPQSETRTASICVDSKNGIYAAIDHLVQLGHQRIAYLGFETPHVIHRLRLDHFIAALAEHNLQVPRDYLQITRSGSMPEAAERVARLLLLPERPTALFAAADLLALGAMRALYDRQVRVPEAMSVISFDNLFAPYLYPPLTSVAQPLEEVAERAISLLIDSLDANDRSADLNPIQVTLPTQLILRDSTAPIG